MKPITSLLNAVRRSMTYEKAKATSLVMLRPLVEEQQLALKAALNDEDYRTTARHFARMHLHAMRASLTRDNLRMTFRLLVGTSESPLTRRVAMAILLGLAEHLRKRVSTSRAPLQRANTNRTPLLDSRSRTSLLGFSSSHAASPTSDHPLLDGIGPGGDSLPQPVEAAPGA